MGSLERENVLVLQTVQALIGLISSNMQAISIQLEDERVIVHFAVRRITSELEEDIDDIIFELDALIPGWMTAEAQVYVGKPDSNWIGRNFRKVYMEKPATVD